jgi:hypothetical protein
LQVFRQVKSTYIPFVSMQSPNPSVERTRNGKPPLAVN